MSTANYDKFPFVAVRGHRESAWQGWDAIGAQLRAAVQSPDCRKIVVAVECYPGVSVDAVLAALTKELRPNRVFRATSAMKTPAELEALVQADLTDDPVFGRLTGLTMADFFDPDRLANARRDLAVAQSGSVLVVGPGASLVAPESQLLVYADLPRWEAQQRFRRDEISNLGVENRTLKTSLQYKRAFFVDWRVADRLKRELFERWDYVLDTTVNDRPKLATGAAVREGLRQCARRPFRVVPFFDPAPWGGQWMKEVCDLDRAAPNYGWCFDCVPEENSLVLGFGDVRLELPAINLVFREPQALLGDAVYARFGAEFPIRFDFLDTMGGGNLSFQVHPLTEYIRSHFGLSYTQDESYYLLDAGPEASVYLGLREGVDREAMKRELEAAQAGGPPFPVERYANRWPARKHDHFLIPAGTVHCSGANSMVLEISATPYIFTFKLWDWGRLGLDGQPRPIHLNHGWANIQWERETDWVRRELIHRVTPVESGEGWREERTGLHEREFIETRRHWFTGSVPHDTGGGVNVLNLVAGDEAVVESPDGAFEPFVVHYAETFIVPAAVGRYTIRTAYPAPERPYGTIKAWVRA